MKKAIANANPSQGSKKSPNVLQKTNQVQTRRSALAPAAKPKPAVSMHDPGHTNAGQTYLHESQGMPVYGSNLWHGSSRARTVKNGILVSGCERLASVTTVNGNSAGALMNRISLNPKLFGVRLPLISEQYDKYVFKKVKLHYIPSITLVNPNANGMLYMVATFDPNEPIPADLDSLAAWATNKTIFPVYEKGSLELDLRLSMQDPLFIDSTGDTRFGVQAVMAIVAGDAQTATSACGQWFIDYEVELSSVNVVASESTNSISIRHLNVGNGEGGPTLASRAVGYFGDPDILTLPPPGSTASYIIAPGLWFMLATIRSTVTLTAITGVPRVNVTGVSNISSANLSTDFKSAAPGFSLAGATVQLANPLGSLYGSNGGIVADPTDAVACASYTIITGANGSPSSVRFDVAPTATTPASPNWMIDILLCRIPTSSYNVSGQSVAFFPRPGPNQILGVKLAQAVDNYHVDDELAPFINAARAFVRVHDAGDSLLASYVNDCFKLGETVTVTTAPMFAHTVAEIGLMLLKKFGPTVAAHILGIAKDKLEKWLERKE